MTDYDDQIRKRTAGRLRHAIAELQTALHVLETAPALNPEPRLSGRPAWQEVVDDILARTARVAAYVGNARMAAPPVAACSCPIHTASRLHAKTAHFD